MHAMRLTELLCSHTHADNFLTSGRDKSELCSMHGGSKDNVIITTGARIRYESDTSHFIFVCSRSLRK